MAKKQEQTLEQLQEDMEDFSNILELSSNFEIPDETSETYKEDLKNNIENNEDKIKEMTKILHKKVFRDTLKIENLSILKNNYNLNVKDFKLDKDVYFKAIKKMANSKVYKFAKIPNPYIKEGKHKLFSEKLVIELSRIILENKFSKDFQYKFNGVFNSIVNFSLLKKMYDNSLLNEEELEYFNTLTIFIFGTSDNFIEDLKVVKESM